MNLHRHLQHNQPQSGQSQPGQSQLRHWRLLLCALTLFAIMGCASTEELYADYDARLCEVIIQRTDEGKTIIKEVLSQDITVWEPAVFFAYDSAEVRKADTDKLDSDVRILARYPELGVAIRGSSDSRGNAVYNLALSQRRVDSVVAYLKANGVDATRFETRALGEKSSLGLSLEEQVHSINRRVELVLLGPDRKQLTTGLDSERIEQLLKRPDGSE